MSIDSLTISILSIVFIATLFRSAFGFGESLVAVPLFAIWIPLSEAVPLSVLMSVTVAGVVVIQDWRKIHFKSAASLTFYTIIGIPLGLLMLTHVNEQLVKGILGAVITLFAGYLLLGKQLKELKTDNHIWLFFCGLFAGILGGAYGLNGPPLVIYGSKRRWSAQHFRATLQGYFLVASIIGMIGFWYSGLVNAMVIHYYLFSLPVMLPAVFAGRAINHRLHGENFFKYIYAILVGIGLLLLIQAVKKII